MSVFYQKQTSTVSDSDTTESINESVLTSDQDENNNVNDKSTF